MKKIKKLMTLTIVIALAIVMTISSSAIYSYETDYKDNLIYQEVGQINLNNLDLNLNNGVLNITGNDTEQKALLVNKLKNNKLLNNAIKESINLGETPISIGYTTVYLKTVKDENGKTHSEPMTIKEVNSSTTLAATSATGKKETKGNLTLYTYAAKTSSSNLTTKSVAVWANGGGTVVNNPADGYDYISITAPSNYAFSSAGFVARLNSGGTMPSANFNRVDQNYTSVVYRYAEKTPPAVGGVKDVTLTMNCKKNTSAGNNIVCISKYVHTWATASPSVGISAGGVSFGLSNIPTAWQIASSVTISE